MLVDELADVLLEPASRRALGGVPPLEYLVHILGATLSGAVAVAVLEGALLCNSTAKAWGAG